METQDGPAEEDSLSADVKEKARLYLRKKAAEQALDDLNKALAVVDARIKSAFEARDIEKISVAGAGTAYLNSTHYPEVLDRAKLVAALKADIEGREIVKEQVNHQSLRSYCLELMEAGKPLPEGVTMKPVVTVGIKVSKSS